MSQLHTPLPLSLRLEPPAADHGVHFERFKKARVRGGIARGSTPGWLAGWFGCWLDSC